MLRSWRRSCIISGLLVLAFLFGFISAGYARAPEVNWTTELLEIKLFPGTATNTSISFNSTGDLNNTSIFIVPEIEPFISIEGTGPDSVMAGIDYVIPSHIEIPVNIPLGTYDGTIHVRQNRRTIPQPLKVLIHVIAPSADIIPSEVSIPSLDRIAMDEEGHELVADEIVIGLDFNLPNPTVRAQQIAAATGGVFLGSIPSLLTYQIQYQVSGLNELKWIRELLETFDDVGFASRHFLMGGPLAVYPNDTEYGTWNEYNDGINNWNLNYINAPMAWAINTGSEDVKVAVIDGDIDVFHNDLRNNIDPNFITGSPNDLWDGHGTHVAGIICAEGNNKEGIAGVSWKCSLHVHNFTASKHKYTSAIRVSDKMDRAVNGGAQVVNMSIAFFDRNECNVDVTPKKTEKIQETNRILSPAIIKGGDNVLWVFGAGNECRDAMDQSPASLAKDFPSNTMVVAGISIYGYLYPTSNHGKLISVAAPGHDIYSTLPQECPRWRRSGPCWDRYGHKSGTSMAAPHVSGLAALVLAENPDFSASQVKECIQLAAQVYGKGVPGHDFKVINAPKAVECKFAAHPVPDTGQTMCLNENFQEVTCDSIFPGDPFYGQDGHYQPRFPMSYTKLRYRGVELPDDALPVDQGGPWIMTKDNVTGLIWEVKNNWDGEKNYNNPHDGDNTYTWYDPNDPMEPGLPSSDGTDTHDFISALNDSKFGGFSDWRVPTIKELHNLYDYSKRPYSSHNLDDHTPINTKYFPIMKDKPWSHPQIWSSTSEGGYGWSAWTIGLGYIDLYPELKFYCDSMYDPEFPYPFPENSFRAHVIAVRGEKAVEHFTDNGDGTVTDNSTGLMWQKKASENTMTWEAALSYCEDKTTAGYRDWRLPTIKELVSLVNFKGYGHGYFPKINPDYFDDGSYHWSSTPYLEPIEYNENWVIKGFRGWGNQYSVASVRAVRDK